MFVLEYLHLCNKEVIYGGTFSTQTKLNVLNVYLLLRSQIAQTG